MAIYWPQVCYHFVYEMIAHLRPIDLRVSTDHDEQKSNPEHQLVTRSAIATVIDSIAITRDILMPLHLQNLPQITHLYPRLRDLLRATKAIGTPDRE